MRFGTMSNGRKRWKRFTRLGWSEFSKFRQSTTFATIVVTTTTPMAVRRRCQNKDTGRLFVPVDRFPPGKAGVERVPVKNRSLADLPAKLDLLAVPQPGKVE